MDPIPSSTKIPEPLPVPELSSGEPEGLVFLQPVTVGPLNGSQKFIDQNIGSWATLDRFLKEHPPELYKVAADHRTGFQRTFLIETKESKDNEKSADQSLSVTYPQDPDHDDVQETYTVTRNETGETLFCEAKDPQGRVTERVEVIIGPSLDKPINVRLSTRSLDESGRVINSHGFEVDLSGATASRTEQDQGDRVRYFNASDGSEVLESALFGDINGNTGAHSFFGLGASAGLNFAQLNNYEGEAGFMMGPVLGLEAYFGKESSHPGLYSGIGVVIPVELQSLSGTPGDALTLMGYALGLESRLGYQLQGGARVYAVGATQLSSNLMSYIPFDHGTLTVGSAGVTSKVDSVTVPSPLDLPAFELNAGVGVRAKAWDFSLRYQMVPEAILGIYQSVDGKTVYGPTSIQPLVSQRIVLNARYYWQTDFKK